MRDLWKGLLFLVYVQGKSRRTQSWDPTTGTGQLKSVA